MSTKTNIVLISLTMILLSGCSHKNAFTKFDIDKDQELSASSIQSGKIKLGGEVAGIFSVIYLNEVYPESYKKEEMFYVYLYLKDNKDDLTIKLNGEKPIEISELPNQNKFSHLTNTQSYWNRYYLVKFKEQGKRLNLVLGNGQSSSAVLKYRKDEQ